MGRGPSRKFSELEIKQLEQNPNVKRVTESNITYSPTFKLSAVRAYNEGQTPMEIFLRAGFNIDAIGHETPKKCLNRWRKVYSSRGDSGLLEERRGKGSTGRPPGELSVEEKLKRAEAKIKFLEAENDFLKKLEALERQKKNELTSSERFQLINEIVRSQHFKCTTRYLCEIAEVSTSGYYRWLNAEDSRQLRDHEDEKDLTLIKFHFKKLNEKAGALTIKTHLEREDGIIMNHKKIRRLMLKYKLVAKVRQANPYRKMAKATQEHHTCPNLLQRQFNQGVPEKVLLTDITYLRYGNGQWAYLSCVKDGATRQILAHYLSATLDLSLVEFTFERLMDRLDGNIHPEAILHSDQGMHYTHPKIQLFIKQTGLRQSMSRKGNCWDNASMESFFGHMKDEFETRNGESIAELRARVDDYISFYNSKRYQWTLKKMTPDEYRSHLMTA